ncbi:hypothetical protein Tco_0700433 [Tanacetum coccineum]
MRRWRSLGGGYDMDVRGWDRGSGGGGGDVVMKVQSAEGPIPPKIAKQKLARKNELKAKRTLLLAILNEHLLKFHGIKDAKTLWEAIKASYLSGRIKSEVAEKTTTALETILLNHEKQNNIKDTISMDELYYNLKVLAVAPPYTGNYMPSRLDLSFAGLDDSVYKTKVSETETSISKTSKDNLEKPKTVRPSAPIIEDWDTDSDNDSVFRPKSDQTKLKFTKIILSNPRGLEGNVIDHTSKDSGSYMLKRFDYVDLQGKLKSVRLGNEAAYTSVEVSSYEGAATTVSSIDAGQGSGNIPKSPTMPHDSPLPGGGRIEDIDQDAGIYLVTPTKVSSQEDQSEDQLGVLSAAKVLADAAKKNVNTYTRRRRAVSTGSEGVSTASRIFSTCWSSSQLVLLDTRWNTSRERAIIIQEYVWIMVYKIVTSFVPMDSVMEKERTKRAGLNLQEESSKSQKTEEGPESTEELKADEISQEDLQQMIMVVPVEEVYVEALQVKYPIIDWEISSTDPTMTRKNIMVELNSYINLIRDDILWKLQRGHDIFMLVEKDYPLTRGLLTLMLCNKLQVDQYSEMAGELLRKIVILANRPRQ